jgi:hypothetical protein
MASEECWVVEHLRIKVKRFLPCELVPVWEVLHHSHQRSEMSSKHRCYIILNLSWTWTLTIISQTTRNLWVLKWKVF